MHKRVRDSEGDSSSTKKIKLDEKVIREKAPTTNQQATTIDLKACTTSQRRLQYLLWKFQTFKEDMIALNETRMDEEVSHQLSDHMRNWIRIHEDYQDLFLGIAKIRRQTKAIMQQFINSTFRQTELKDIVKFLEINHAYDLTTNTKTIVHHLALNDVHYASPADFSQRYILTVLSIYVMIV